VTSKTNSATAKPSDSKTFTVTELPSFPETVNGLDPSCVSPFTSTEQRFPQFASTTVTVNPAFSFETLVQISPEKSENTIHFSQVSLNSNGADFAITFWEESRIEKVRETGTSSEIGKIRV
jgi:hypothetical protein